MGNGASTPEYALDQDGHQILDIQGNPMTVNPDPLPTPRNPKPIRHTKADITFYQSVWKGGNDADRSNCQALDFYTRTYGVDAMCRLMDNDQLFGEFLADYGREGTYMDTTRY